MSVGRRGLRHGGGTSITRCCGKEAIMPQRPDADWEPTETEDGTPITESEFPDADLVCPGCGRTWPGEGCQHESYEVTTDISDIEADQSSVWVGADCNDCDERLNVLLEVGDVREVDL